MHKTMKKITLNTALLLTVLLLIRCNCKRKVITEKELDTIAIVKQSPELAAYKEAFKKKDSCLQFEMGQQAFYNMSRVHHMLANSKLTRQEREDSARKFNFKVNPCFWERQAKRQKLFNELCVKYPAVTKLSPMAFHNLVNVN
jgi:hypothetical protein